jgi:hypothetical protein
MVEHRSYAMGVFSETGYVNDAHFSHVRVGVLVHGVEVTL